MENKQIARILRETAQLLEIDGAIIGRYRSYEKAVELIDSLPESIEQLVAGVHGLVNARPARTFWAQDGPFWTEAHGRRIVGCASAR